jgi:hypothetical protein
VEALGFVAGVVDLDWALACFVKLCCLALGRWFVGPVEGRLFAELAKARGGLLWRSDSIGSMTEAVFGYCLGDFVGKEMGRMRNIVGEVAPTAWCDLLLWMSIVVEVGCGLAPFFFWILEIWGNILCGGWCHCHGTCSTEA